MDIGISTKSTEKYQTSAKVCNEEFKKNMIDYKVSTENTEKISQRVRVLHRGD